MGFILVGALLLISWSKFLYPQLYSQYKSLLFNQKYLLSFHKGKMLSHPYVLSMGIVSWLNLSLFCYLIIPDLFPGLENQFKLSYLHIATYSASFIVIKTWIQLLLTRVFDNQLIKRLLLSKLSFLSFSSLVLAIGSLLLIYLSNHNLIIIYSIISLFLLLYLIGCFNELRNHKKIAFKHLLYFILYLCSLEIAPLIIIINYLKIA